MQRSILWIPVCLALSLAWNSVRADQTAAELLPDSTALYIEVRQPAAVLESILEHPFYDRILALDAVRTAREQKPYLDFKAGVAAIESQLGSPWPKVVKQLVGGGVSFAADTKTGGAILLMRAADETTPARLLESVIQLARLDATNKGNPDPIKTGDYRGIQAYELANVKIVHHERWVFVTNNSNLAKVVADRMLGDAGSSLAQDAQFVQAAASSQADAAAWGYVNTKMLRDAGAGKKVLAGPTDNPLAELLVGGLFPALQNTPYVTLTLAGSADQLQLTANAPFDRQWVGENREYFFGPQSTGRAPSTIQLAGTIFSLSAYRDISGMWLRAGDLFNEKTNEELAKADSNLTTLFGGKDFGEDILGALQPEVQLIVKHQEFAAGQPAPAIKLPAFALVSTLRDPEKMQPELRRTFQSLIGFLNVVGAMNGQPQLDLDMDKTDNGQIIISRYLPDPQAKDLLGLKINYNFSPSVAFAGDRFIVASTEALARQLAAATTGKPSEPSDRTVNTTATLEFEALHQALGDNKAQLVAQNMLQEGNTKEEAEKAIDGLLQLVSWFDRAGLQLDTTTEEIRLSVELAIEKGK